MEYAKPRRKHWWKKDPWRIYLIDRYAFCQSYIGGKEVLEAGCGCGWGTSMLSGYAGLVGVDMNREAIDYAREHYPGILWVADNILGLGKRNTWAKPGSFDVILCLETLEHLTYCEGRQFLIEARELLTPDGKLILQVPILVHRKTTGNPYHLCEYYEPELNKLIKSIYAIENYALIKSPAGVAVRAVLCNQPGQQNVTT